MHYSSARVPGNKAAKTVQIPLFDENLPKDVKRAEVSVSVAGKEYKQSFIPKAKAWTTFEWDGEDAYQRKLKGTQKAKVKVSYIYDAVYYEPGDFERAFGQLSGVPISSDRVRQEIELSQSWDVNIAGDETITNAIAGWNLDIHHSYDPKAGILYYGNGERRSAQAIGRVIKTVAKFDQAISDIAIAADGSIYLTHFVNNIISKIDPEGNITQIAGKKKVEGFSGDGGPAVNAKLSSPYEIVIGPDNSIYFVDYHNKRIRRIDQNGIITTVGGNGVHGYTGDGGPATAASISNVQAMAVATDGSIYIYSDFFQCLRRIGPDGIIETIAKATHMLESGFPGDGRPLSDTQLGSIKDLVFGKDGSLYIANAYKVWRVTPDGLLYHIGGGEGSFGEGLPAKDTKILRYGTIVDLAVDSVGNIYLATFENHTIRVIDTEGIIRTIAGGGTEVDDNVAATKAKLVLPSNITVDFNDNVYFIDQHSEALRKIYHPLPGFDDNDLFVASEDGSQLYHFNKNGKHLETLDALTQKPIYRFEYDEKGYLKSITDINGKVTTITRDGNGNPTGIIAPYGQETILTVNPDGYLENVTNPASEKYQMTYYPGGLLATFTDPRGNGAEIFYDDNGRLIKDVGLGGRVVKLERTDIGNGFTVTKTVSLTDQSESVSTYQTEYLSDGRTKWAISGCCGGTTETVFGTDGSKTITHADGTKVTIQEGPDPRFGMQAPIIKSMTVTTPDGKKYVMTGERTVKLSDPTDLFSIETITDTVTVNGKTTTTVYDAKTKTVTTTSPEGRQTVTTLDEFGRVIKTEVPGLVPATIEYDEHGRIAATISGSGLQARSSRIKYNEQGYVASVTDPLERTTEFHYDAVGRVTKQVLPNQKEIVFEYDDNGNVTKLVPPGKPEHTFGYTVANLEETYTPPTVGAGENQTKYDYNLNKQPTLITRPDGQTIGFEYDTNGRLLDIKLPNEESITYGYHPTSGNLVNIIASSGALTYDYDGSLLKKVTWKGLIKGSVEYEYNNDFNVTKVSVNGNDTISYDYDKDGLLTKAGAVTLERNPDNGMLTDIKIGSILEKLLYNQFGETDTYRVTVNGSTVFETGYQTDKLGRIETKTETVAGVTSTYRYHYDLIGQLTDVYKDGVLIAHYDYDSNGNRTGYSGVHGTITDTEYDAQDRLLRYGDTHYFYTDNGELRSKVKGTELTKYDYDVLGNLRTVELPDGTKIEYIIDGQNRRIGKKVNGTLVQGFIYQDSLNPIAELDASGNVVARFVYGTRGNVPDYIIKDGVTYRIISDHLGSVRMVVNVATGDIVQKMEYDEFGRVLTDTNPGFLPFGYAGGIYDQQTGLVRFGARDYDPEVGRWTAKDPIGFEGEDSNLYGYCWNDPVNYIDPSGEVAVALAPAALIPGVGQAVLVGAGVTVVVAAATVGAYELYKWARDRYAAPRPGIKGQGRENTEKKKGKNWKPKSGKRNPNRPPKKHTPGRDHRKFRIVPIINDTKKIECGDYDYYEEEY